MKLKEVEFNGKKYPVTFKQSPNYSQSNMDKSGMVYHVTTSHSYVGGKSWLTNKNSGVSCLFIIGSQPGEIAQLGLPNQKLWHAGRISNPSEHFKKIAKKSPSGKYTNPNLWLDGIEFVGGVDKDRNGKVERDEVNLTEWQYYVGQQVCEWHAEVCGYNLKPENQIIHQDIASYKPDLEDVRDEMHYRLFSKENREESCKDLEIEIARQNGIIKTLRDVIALLANYIKSKLR